MVLLWIQARALPDDAPAARMYRAEADIAALARAVDAYYQQHGVYPPAGEAGLRLAIETISGRAPYFAGGPPPDPWGRPYRYVPHTQYGDPNSGALESLDGYFAPTGYQIYSDGADGAPGLERPEGQHDNICNWDAAKSWRPLYREMTEQYLADRR